MGIQAATFSKITNILRCDSLTDTKISVRLSGQGNGEKKYLWKEGNWKRNSDNDVSPLSNEQTLSRKPLNATVFLHACGQESSRSH